MAANTLKCTYTVIDRKTGEERQCANNRKKGTLCTRHWKMGKPQGEPESCDEDDSFVSTPARSVRTSTPGRYSTPPTSIGRSSIGELGSLLKDLHVGDDSNHHLLHHHLHHPGAESLLMPPPQWITKPKRVDSAESENSFGPRDPDIRQLKEYMPQRIHGSVYKDVTVALAAPPRDRDRPGYVYILHVIPVRKRHSSASADENSIATTNKIIIKVGRADDVSARIKTLSYECKHHKYKRLEAFPETGPIELSYKAEELVQANLKNWAYRSGFKCLCDKEHMEFYEVEPKELKAVYACVKHWADVVNKAKDKLWVHAPNSSIS